MITRLALFSFLFVFQSCAFMRDEVAKVHVLPQDFRGEAKIIFEHPNGLAEEYNSNGARVYRFDSLGICRTRFDAIEGRRVVSLFYLGSENAVQNQIFSAVDSILYNHKFESGDAIVTLEVQGTINGLVEYNFNVEELD